MHPPQDPRAYGPATMKIIFQKVVPLMATVVATYLSLADRELVVKATSEFSVRFARGPQTRTLSVAAELHNSDDGPVYQFTLTAPDNPHAFGQTSNLDFAALMSDFGYPLIVTEITRHAHNKISFFVKLEAK